MKNLGRNIYQGNITIEKANEYQTDLLVKIMNFGKNTKPSSQEKKQEKKMFLKACIIFLSVEK